MNDLDNYNEEYHRLYDEHSNFDVYDNDTAYDSKYGSNNYHSDFNVDQLKQKTEKDPILSHAQHANVAENIKEQAKNQVSNNDVAQGYKNISFATNVLLSGKIDEWTSENIRSQNLQRSSVANYSDAADFIKNNTGKNLETIATASNTEIRNVLKDYCKINGYDDFSIGDKYSKLRSGEFDSRYLKKDSDNLSITFRSSSGDVTKSFKDIDISQQIHLLDNGQSKFFMKDTYESSTFKDLFDYHKKATVEFDSTAIKNQHSLVEAMSQDAIFVNANVHKMSARNMQRCAQSEEWCKKHNIDDKHRKIMLQGADIIKQGNDAKVSAYSHRKKQRTSNHMLSLAQRYYGGDVTAGVVKIVHGKRIAQDAISTYGVINGNRLSKRITKTNNKITKLENKSSLSNRQLKRKDKLQKKNDKLNKKQQRKQDRLENPKTPMGKARKRRNDKKNARERKKLDRKDCRSKWLDSKFGQNKIYRGFKKIGDIKNTIKERIQKFFLNPLSKILSFFNKIKIAVLFVFVILLFLPVILEGFIMIITSLFGCFTKTSDTIKGISVGEEMIQEVVDKTVALRDKNVNALKASIQNTTTCFFTDAANTSLAIIGPDGVSVYPKYYNSHDNTISEVEFYQTREIITAIQMYSNFSPDYKTYKDQVDGIFDHTHSFVGSEDADNLIYHDWYNKEEMDGCTNKKTLYHSKEIAQNSSSANPDKSFTNYCNKRTKEHGKGKYVTVEFEGVKHVSEAGNTCGENGEFIKDWTNLVKRDSEGYIYKYTGEYFHNADGSKIKATGEYTLSPKGYLQDASGNKVIAKTTVYKCNHYICKGHENVCSGHIVAYANFKVKQVDHKINEKNGKKILDTSNTEFFENCSSVLSNYYTVKKNPLDMTKDKNVKTWNMLNEFDWEGMYGVSLYDGSTGLMLMNSEPLTTDQMNEIKKQAGGKDNIGYKIVETANSKIGSAYLYGSSHGTSIETLTDERIDYYWNKYPDMHGFGTLLDLKAFYAPYMNSNCYDCTGFVYHCWLESGVPISRAPSSKEWLSNPLGFKEVSKGELMPGDICVKDGHAALYAGVINGQMSTIGAEGTTNGVVFVQGGVDAGGFTKFYRAQ